MTSVASVSGSGSIVSSVKRLFICVIFAYINFIVSFYAGEPIKNYFTMLLNSVPMISVPFAGLVVLESALYIFFISLSYRLAGPIYGIVTALLTASFFLLMGPWCGILRPYYFSVFGFVAFIVMGILVERANGGFANLAFGLVNWTAAAAFGVSKVTPLGVVVFSICAFATGLAADYAARAVSRVVYPHVSRALS